MAQNTGKGVEVNTGPAHWAPLRVGPASSHLQGELFPQPPDYVEIRQVADARLSVLFCGPGRSAGRFKMTTFVDDGSGALTGLHALVEDQVDLVRSALFSARGGELDEEALAAAVSRYERGDYSFNEPIHDQSEQSLSFNAMPGKNIEEVLRPRVYFAGRDVARVVFDRGCETALERGPRHLLFLSALIQWQKLIYIMMSHRLGLGYDLNGPEVLRIWPTEVQCRMPTMIPEDSNLLQDAVMSKLQFTGSGTWTAEGFSVVNRRLGLVGRALITKIA